MLVVLIVLVAVASVPGKVDQTLLYFLLCNKKSRFDFADELKVGDVRYKHLTKITIKVELFWRLPYEM